MLIQLRGVRSRRRGATAVELVLGTVCATLIAAGGFASLQSGRNAFSRGAIESSLRTEATRVLDAVATEIADCGASTTSIAAADSKGGPYLTLQHCTGAAGSNPTWGPVVTVGFVYNTKGSNGGWSSQTNVINSCSGIQVTKGTSSYVLGGNAVAAGLQVSKSGSMINLTLTLKRPVPNEIPVTVSSTRTVHLAN